MRALLQLEGCKLKFRGHNMQHVWPCTVRGCIPLGQELSEQHGRALGLWRVFEWLVLLGYVVSGRCFWGLGVSGCTMFKLARRLGLRLDVAQRELWVHVLAVKPTTKFPPPPLPQSPNTGRLWAHQLRRAGGSRCGPHIQLPLPSLQLRVWAKPDIFFLARHRANAHPPVPKAGAPTLNPKP